jgi:4-hydroxy 2-oxovalerate aldolase
MGWRASDKRDRFVEFYDKMTTPEVFQK